jgi:hypothetical protein
VVVGENPVARTAVQKIGEGRALDAYAADARTVGFVTVKNWLGREYGRKAPRSESRPAATSDRQEGGFTRYCSAGREAARCRLPYAASGNHAITERW